MTANKHVKRRVRERSRRTGESYTAALRHLRQVDAEEQTVQSISWRRIEKPEWGYAVAIPEDWAEQPPNLANSPWETARFAPSDDRRRTVIVFRNPFGVGRTPAEAADLNQVSLERAGFNDFSVADVTVAGRDGARLDCARHDAGRVWAVREYFVSTREVGFCVGCGSSVPAEDEPLFDAIAERFELLETVPRPADG